MANTKIKNKRKKKLFYGRLEAPCHYCGDLLTWSKATLDHKIPRSIGGTLAHRNIVLACEDCNFDKGNLTEFEYRQVLEERKRIYGANTEIVRRAVQGAEEFQTSRRVYKEPLDVRGKRHARSRAATKWKGRF